MVAPIFVLLVLAFVAFAGLVMASFAARVGPWQLWAFVGWLVGCGALVVGGTFAERRR